jgi:thiol-disulfide isomerase/thioredoxin
VIKVDLAGRRRTVLRWALVAVVVALAVGVALWPLWVRDEPAGPAPAGSATAGVDLASLRQQAALRSCPQAVATPARPAQAGSAGSPGSSGGASGLGGPLAGVRVPCLGAEGTVDLGAALAGRAVLLNVWSHTCEPCRDELPALAEYAARPGAVEVLGVQVDGSPQAGLALLVALGVRLPSVTDPDGALRAALRAPQVLPLSYVVAPDGGVRMVNPPVVFRAPDEIDQVVRGYLATS